MRCVIWLQIANSDSHAFTNCCTLYLLLYIFSLHALIISDLPWRSHQQNKKWNNKDLTLYIFQNEAQS